VCVCAQRSNKMKFNRDIWHTKPPLLSRSLAKVQSQDENSKEKNSFGYVIVESTGRLTGE